MPKLVLAASLMAALVLAACGSATPPPSQAVVSPPPAVGLLGRTADTRSLDDWAWFGNEDVPGIPTLWQQDFVYRP